MRLNTLRNFLGSWILLVAGFHWNSVAFSELRSYRVDPSHTTVIFKIFHLGLADFRGRFNRTTGNIRWDKADASKSSVEIRVEAGSIDTKHSRRDLHLRGPDFFNAVRFPAILFRSQSISAVGENQYQVKGDLSLHGVTRKVTLNTEFTGEGNDPWGGYRVGFKSQVVVNRSDYGMKFMLDQISDRVEILMSFEAIRQP